jgi:SagB-type dehydrogenase family enzyme
MDELRTTLDFHERTKHHPHRYAASMGFLDWENQPIPFRSFEGAEIVELPFVEDREHRSLHELGLRDEPEEPSLTSVSRFLELSLGITAWKAQGGARWALRANPSSGNLHPTEGYAVLPELEGLGGAGVFHYRSLDHVLERRCRLSASTWARLLGDLPAGSFLVGLSSVVWREAWKYGERSFRYCQHDVGHALAALSYAAHVCGWSLRMLPGPSDEDVAGLLGLEHGDCEPVEREHPDLLAVVGAGVSQCDPGQLGSWSPEPVQDELRALEWSGRPNRLSREHHDWPILEVAARATAKPPTPQDLLPLAASIGPAPEGAASGPSAPEIIRRRRSAVAFDGRTEISRERFLAMLERLRPRPELPPYEALAWSPSLFLGVFVHRVQGLEPGLYALLRDGSEREEIAVELGDELEWRPVAEGLPLYLLKSGDHRDVAGGISCHQDIAADCAFSLGMLVELRPRLEEHGPWFWRRAFWETGLLGQAVYLEAEQIGLRATGIGCFFDDEMHALLGLRGDRYQSLYHFAIGTPVDDPRITTLPAYRRQR